MSVKNVRLEVMGTIEKFMDDYMNKYLTPVEKIWQPSDLLPDPRKESFFEEWKELRELSKELGSDFWAVFVGDMITEEALPTYESWLMDIEGIHQKDQENGWSKWIKAWTAEENRHGDLLSKFLYMSGRVNMREVEISMQYLIADGMDIGTSRDPYRNFVYTSFQELATNVSHRRVAKIAKQHNNKLVAKMCGHIASDELRHARAYKHFASKIFEFDPSEMMLAFEDMMKKKIVMPAHMLRESGGRMGELFERFSESAQRLGVYTTYDYIDIFKSLLDEWEIEKITGLNDRAEKARDYLVKLPDRLTRISQRMKVPETKYDFKWIRAATAD